MTNRQRTERIYKALLCGYCLYAVVLAIYYGVKGNLPHFLITVGTLAIPLFRALVWKTLCLMPVWNVSMLTLGFAFLSYSLGSCLDLYQHIPGYDKLMEYLSGIHVSLLAILLYYYLKPNHKIEQDDAALAIMFMVFTSISISGLWEIGEFLISRLIHTDFQRVQTSGVADTMEDMMFGLLGTLTAIPLALRTCHGKSGPWTNSVTAFSVEVQEQRKEK